MKPTLLALALVTLSASAQTNLTPATTNTSAKATRPTVAPVPMGGVFDTPKIIAYRQRHGADAVVPIDLLEEGLAGAVNRREQLAQQIGRETNVDRDARNAVANNLVEFGNSTDLLKRMAAVKAQAQGIPRHAMGSLRAYAAPTLEDYCRGDARWQAADREVRQWQALIRSRQEAEARAAKAALPRESPETAARVAAFLQEQANQGSPRARYELGLRLLEGRGLPPDEPKGRALIALAAADGHEPAQEFLKTEAANPEPAP